MGTLGGDDPYGRCPSVASDSAASSPTSSSMLASSAVDEWAARWSAEVSVGPSAPQCRPALSRTMLPTVESNTW